MWGIIPAAGHGSRIQPLAFSKELLPVGSRVEDGGERPRAISEYLVERMIRGGADRLCFVISPGKTDILEYYGSRLWGADIAYVVQPSAGGLCDAVFRALPLVRGDETVLIGLPDTLWAPEDGFRQLPDGVLSFLLFPVEHPELFDAVVTDEDGSVVGDRGEEGGCAIELDLGCDQDAGKCVARAPCAVAGTGARRRIPGDSGERVDGGGWACGGGAGGAGVCGCWDAAWIQVGDPAARGKGRSGYGACRQGEGDR